MSDCAALGALADIDLNALELRQQGIEGIESLLAKPFGQAVHLRHSEDTVGHRAGAQFFRRDLRQVEPRLPGEDGARP